MPKLSNAYSDTRISVAKTQEEFAALLAKHGVKASGVETYEEDIQAKTPGMILFKFRMDRDGVPIDYRLSVKYQTVRGPRGGNQGTTREQAARALLWYVKSMFEAVEFGIVTVEQAFMAAIVTRSGVTMGEVIEEQPTTIFQIANGTNGLLMIEGG